MSIHSDKIERCAFALFQTFIRNAVGTCKPKRNSAGQVTGLETLDEAAQRRWHQMPELSRERFRVEAAAVLAAA